MSARGIAPHGGTPVRALLALELRRIRWRAANTVASRRTVLMLLGLLGGGAWLGVQAYHGMGAEMRAGAEAIRTADALREALAGGVAMMATFFSVMMLLPSPRNSPPLRTLRRLREEYLRGAGVSPGVLAVREVAGQLLWHPLLAVCAVLMVTAPVWLLLAPLHRALLLLAFTAVLMLGAALSRAWRFGGPRARFALGVPLGAVALHTLVYNLFADGHFAPELRRAVVRWDFHLAPWRLLLDPAAGPLACALLFVGALATALASARWSYVRMGWEAAGGAAAEEAPAAAVDAGTPVVVRGPLASLVRRDVRRLTRLSKAEKLSTGYFLLIPLLQFAFLSWQSPAIVQTLLDPVRVHWLGTVVGALPAIALGALLWHNDSRATWAWHRTTLAAPQRLIEVRSGVLGTVALLYIVLLAGLAFAAGGGAGTLRLLLWAVLAATVVTCATALANMALLRVGRLGSAPAQMIGLLMVVALAATPGLVQSKTGHAALAIGLALLLAGACVRVAGVLYCRAEFLPASA